MEDRYGRRIDYLRISVTDKCNLRCFYCMPEEGIPSKHHLEILRFEEILRFVRVAAGLGVRKVRITGGEPLARRGIVDFVAELAAIPGISEVAMTTNGTLLKECARSLKQAGLHRVNISLDTLDRDKFHRITRRGRLEDVWAGIEAALESGLTPVKLNTVLMRGVNGDEVLEFARMTVRRPLHVRFIELMPIGESDASWADSFLPVSRVREAIEREMHLVPVAGKMGNGPAEYYQAPGAQGTIGFISAISNHFCSACNRLRLTADGRLRPCLQDRLEVDVRDALRQGEEDEPIRQAIVRALCFKPGRHHMTDGWQGQERMMSDIGG